MKKHNMDNKITIEMEEWKDIRKKKRNTKKEKWITDNIKPEKNEGRGKGEEKRRIRNNGMGGEREKRK